MYLLEVLRARPGWSNAVHLLQELQGNHGQAAAIEAAGYSEVYRDRRGAMVFDVVASRQRRYRSRVQPMVTAFSDEPQARDLRRLAADGPGPGWGLRAGEGETMQNVARGLIRYCDDHSLDIENGVRNWAAATHELVEVHRLDPYVGEVKGIGPALFAYLRMRAGGDGIKPDIRVRRALNTLGFAPPAGDVALLRIAAAAASEVRVSLLQLDQLLWWTLEPGGSQS